MANWRNMIQWEIDREEPDSALTPNELEYRFPIRTNPEASRTYHDGFGANDLNDLLDAEFDSGYGSAEGVPFLAWSANRIYFPVECDGAESVDSLPRNPSGADDEDLRHIG